MSDKVFARGSFLYRKRDGYVDALQYNGVTLGDDDVLSVRGQVRFELSDATDLTLAGDYTREREHGGPWVATNFFGGGPFTGRANLNTGVAACLTPEGQNSNPACVGPVQLAGPFATNNTFYDITTGARIEPESNLDVYGISAVLNADLGWASFKSITAYRDLDADFDRSIGHSPALVFQNPNELFESQAFTQEFQLVGSSDALDWVAGLYYLDEDARQRPSGFHALNGAALPATPDDRNIMNEAFAAFGQATWHATESLHLTLGLRYTDEEKDFSIAGFAPVTGVQRFGFGGIQQAQETTPHFSVRYDITDDVNVYASYGEGFRSGTFAARINAADAALVEQIGLPSTAPEFVETVELGIKTTFFDQRVRLNAAFFQTDYDDIQVEFRPDPPFSGQGTLPGNVAVAEVDGFEVELTALLSSSLTLNATLGLLDAAYTDIDPAVTAITLDDALVYSPDYQGTIRLNHSWLLQNGAEIVTNLNWKFTDEQALQAQNAGDPFAVSDSWNRADLSFSYIAANEKWDLALHIRNLTDQLYVTSVQSNPRPPFLISEAIYSRPQEVFGTLTYRY